jgi:hypothetical protein
MNSFEDIVKQELYQKIQTCMLQKVYPNHSYLGPSEMEELTEEINFHFREYLIPLNTSRIIFNNYLEETSAEYSKYLVKVERCKNSIDRLEEGHIKQVFREKYALKREDNR